MKHINRSAIVQYRAEQMYALAADIERYPEFLPWCAAAAIEAEDDTAVVASITVHHSGVCKSFTTHNHNVAGRSITMELAGPGPFRELHGAWRFTPLSAQSCKVEFEMRFRFINHAMALLIGPLFGRIADTMVDAFHQRACIVYGEKFLEGVHGCS